MAKMLQILTVNRLRDGEVLYWRQGEWVGALGDAEIFADSAQAHAALAQANEAVRARLVVNPYLFDVRLEGSQIHPVKEREIIRAAGPTVRRDLGKQADHVQV
jgi:hypothetical protein